MTPPPGLRIATWNVNGLRARAAQLAEWIAAERPDVVCLQEIKCAPEQVPAELHGLDGHWCRWHGAGAYSGVALLVRKELLAGSPRFHHPGFDRDSRIVVAEIGELTIASVYVPNGGRDLAAKLAFLDDLEAWARERLAAGGPLLIAGDLNVTRGDRDVHPKERKAGMVGQRPDERERLERLLAAGLVDLGRALDPDNDGLFTWWAPWRNHRQRNIGWRLDYLLASEPLARATQSCRVLPAVGTSDHAPVLASFARPSPVATSS